MERNVGKIWKVKKPDETVLRDISSHLGVSRLFATILANRSLCELDQIQSFLGTDLSTLSDPMEMADIERAAGRIIEACERDEKIFIYADYDVDGATGAACLYLFLKELFPYLQVYIHQNDRIKDGYGLKMEYMRFAARTGFSLIVTVDSGISDFAEVEETGHLGTDVIITDHHSVRDTIPNAFAVLNPQRKDCNYGFKGLAGVGVVFALICAIRKILRNSRFFAGKREIQLSQYLDLVALGTVADLAPLTGDNRMFVKYGLLQIRRNPRPGILALLDVSGVKQEYVNEVDLAYRIGPRLNAAGRVGDSSLSSAILIESSDERAKGLARILSRENRKRQMEEDRIFKEARRIIEEDDLHKGRFIVIGSENWHIGVVGIVASKIAESYSRPALVFSFDGSDAKGSGRSKSPFDILKILHACSDHIERYGGHPRAAGVVVKRERLEKFSEAVQAAMLNLYGEEKMASVIDVDAEVDLASLTKNVLDELEALSPYGIGNPEPLLLSRNLMVSDVSVRNRGLITMDVVQGGIKFEVLAFNMRELKNESPERIDLLYSPKLSVYRGRSEIKLMARDMRLL